MSFNNFNRPILFYSKKCINCQKLWGILVQENRLGDFIKICVEENPTKIPPMIREVPSILVSKERPVISGSAIHMYLKSVPSTSTSAPSQPNFSQNTQSVPPASSSETDGLNGIKDFNPIEMSNAWSDSYSFIQDNPQPMKFSFEFLDNSQTAYIGSIDPSQLTRK
jgi:hypothetical protein